MYEFASSAEKNNFGVIIAGAGVSTSFRYDFSNYSFACPWGSYREQKTQRIDSLLSIAQMPKGIPVGTLAIGEDGAINAALLATAIIAIVI